MGKKEGGKIGRDDSEYNFNSNMSNDSGDAQVIITHDWFRTPTFALKVTRVKIVRKEKKTSEIRTMTVTFKRTQDFSLSWKEYEGDI